jgi:hypothetical protein
VRISLSPVGRQLADFLVVAAKAMDTRFDQDKAELRVLILPVALQMLADRHSLLDQAVKILRDLRGKSCTGHQPQHRTRTLNRIEELYTP